MKDILEVMKENGFFDNIADLLNCDKLEYDSEKKKWFYLRADSSGRDFLEPVPFKYITESECDYLAEYLLDDYDLGDYDWNGFSADDVEEYIYENIYNILSEVM